MATFENPQNGYRESVTFGPFVWALLFGPLYYMIRGIWSHAIVLLILTLVLWPTIIGAMFVWIVWAFLAPIIVANSYRRKGWVEVKQPPFFTFFKDPAPTEPPQQHAAAQDRREPSLPKTSTSRTAQARRPTREN